MQTFYKNRIIRDSLVIRRAVVSLKVPQIIHACQDVAWEYDAMLAAAVEMPHNHCSPLSHLVQEAFLAHVRNLAEFFNKGTEEFGKTPTPPGCPLARFTLMSY